LRDIDVIPETIAAYCKHCEGHRVLDVKGRCVSTPYQDGNYINGYCEYTILGACEECGQPIVAQNWGAEADSTHGGKEFRTIYPIDEKTARKIQFDLPATISKSYDDAVKCEQTEAWNPCIVMIGRALEAVAKDYNPKIKTISTGLKKMHAEGVISNELFEWANEIRILRNIGAHATEEDVEEVDARESLDFLQAILETIYHLRPMFQKMKERRKKDRK